MDFLIDKRFEGIIPFKEKVWLASPTKHKREELDYIEDAFEKNWLTTSGDNVNVMEELACRYIGVPYSVGLTNGTAALHMAVKLAAEKLYNSHTGTSTPDRMGLGGSLLGKRVFCANITFDASVNPIIYEGGEPIFVDSEYETWNMDPKALEKAFELYPDVKIVMLVHLYGTPAKLDEIKAICEKHRAILIEDAAEALGAIYKDKPVGSFGDYSAISFNGNRIITGSAGGQILLHDEYSAEKVKKWSTQSREKADWYEHEELGYNYRISNLIAGMIRGQWPHLKEHIAQKKAIYGRYMEGFKNLPVTMNPINEAESEPNYWLSCLLIDKEAMEPTSRSDRGYTYNSEPGKSCPSEILEALKAFNAEGRPIWKPMSSQPIFRSYPYITVNGNCRGNSNAYTDVNSNIDISADIFERGLCLPSDNKMKPEEQDRVIEIVKRCFD